QAVTMVVVAGMSGFGGVREPRVHAAAGTTSAAKTRARSAGLTNQILLPLVHDNAQGVHDRAHVGGRVPRRAAGAACAAGRLGPLVARSVQGEAQTGVRRRDL